MTRLGALLIACLHLALVGAQAAAPTRVASYGPNGTHWPSLIETPFMYDAATTAQVIDVACSWSAIDTALAGIDSTEADAGVIIRVANGSLTGSGDGSTSTPAIAGRGSSSWAKRVTITPLNGQGAVTITNARIDTCKNICWAGFNWGVVVFTGCDGGAMAWGKVGLANDVDGNAGYGGFDIYSRSGHAVSNFEVVEIVDRVANTAPYDGTDVYAAGANLNNFRWDGCYFAPRYMISEDSHLDVLQFEVTAGGSLGSHTVRDSIFFAANNSAIQLGSGTTIAFIKSAIVGGTVSRGRYPLNNTLHPSAVQIGNPSVGYFGALNGAGSASFVDSLVWTATTGTTVSSVTSSSMDGGSQSDGFGGAPASGSWTLEPSMTLAGKSIMAEPSDEYLATIWADPGAGDTSDPIISSVVATVTGQTTTTVTWTTDEAASSVVDYGLTASYGSTATGSSGVTGHSVNITGLTAATTYHYRVRSTDAASNEAVSSDGTFQTLSAPTPAPVSVHIIRIASMGRRNH